LYKEIVAIAGNLTGKFTLQPMKPRLEARSYAHNLQMRADKGNILVINKVDEDFYLSGVCEAEAGCAARPEYFKTQAIISRTYLYAHFNRHAKDGFNLCDGIHCQAYKGLLTQCHKVRKAVNETENMLIIDGNEKPITPTFFANCGGQTCNSEDVWSEPLPYLRSIKDGHCENQRGSHWQKRISLGEWRSFMSRNGIIVKNVKQFEFEQSTRKKYYTVNKKQIELTRIRQQFGLRSTFFDVKVVGNDVVLMGHGYGHGVGLCQEGAMRMADKGYKHNKILPFYYKKTHVGSFEEVIHSDYMLLDYGDIFNPWIERHPSYGAVEIIDSLSISENGDAEVDEEPFILDESEF
jgi:stage II sporulation protein D